MDTVKFGSFLKELRKARGLTQEQLAEKMGVTNRTVSRWETGTNLPDLDILLDLSEFYQIDIKNLLNGEREAGAREKENTEMIRQVAEYCTIKEAHIVRKIFFTVVAGVVAVGSLYYMTLRFFQDVTNSGIVLLSLIVTFQIYTLTMQAFQDNRSAVGYRITLTSGFIAMLICNILILFLFFGSGSYHNYGLAGFYYILAIVMITFAMAGILSRFLIRWQLQKVS